MEGKQSELSPKKLELYKRLPGTNAHKVLATVNSLTPVTYHGLCEGELLCDCDRRVSDVGLSLLSPVDAAFFPHCQYGHLEYLWRSCRMILESGGKGNEWRWNPFEPSCKDS